MERCKIVERPVPPPLPTPTQEELIAASLEARVVPGELPPPPPPTDTEAADGGGYNFRNYYYRGWEGRPRWVAQQNQSRQAADSDTEILREWPGDSVVTGLNDDVLGRWYVSRTSTGSRDDRRVRPQPISFDNGPRRNYIPALTGVKTLIVTISGSIMADNGGPRRITSPTTRFRLIRSHYENPHYTDVRNGSVVVAPSGSGRPEDYPPSVTVGCAAPTAVVRTNELRRVWRDQANPLWVAGMASSDWIFHGPLGDEMWIDELYEQIDWTLDATEAGHPTGSLTQRWRPLRYAWNEPRRPGDFIERVPEPGRNATPEEIREYRLEAEDRLARGINYEPFLSPVSSPINRTPEPYTDTAAGPWDAYRSEIEWLTRTFAQPQYAGTTGIPDAATSIPEVLRDYLVGVCTVWNRINRESNVIRELHNSLPGRQVYELQPPRFVKLIINETKYISGGSGGGGGGGAGATTFTYNPNTGQLETQQAPTAVL